jgi:hypothetical protein
MGRRETLSNLTTRLAALTKKPGYEPLEPREPEPQPDRLPEPSAGPDASLEELERLRRARRDFLAARGRSPHSQVIIARNRIYLRTFSGGADQQARFVRAFRRTWKRLPLGDRRRLLKHWRENCPLALVRNGHYSPLVEVQYGWQARNEEPLAGSWRSSTHRLFFLAPAVVLMPNRHLDTLIAHELAHAALTAAGCDDKNDEELAEGIVDLWGFDQYALIRWIVEHRERILALEAEAEEERQARELELAAMQERFRKIGPRFG